MSRGFEVAQKIMDMFAQLGLPTPDAIEALGVVSGGLIGNCDKPVLTFERYCEFVLEVTKHREQYNKDHRQKVTVPVDNFKPAITRYVGKGKWEIIE